MKRIKGTLRNTHKLIMLAVKDYYNDSVFRKEYDNVAKHLSGEKISLTAEEKSDAWAIEINMADEIYCKTLIRNG